VFTCVLALMLCSLLRRQLSQAGIDRSIVHLLDTLGQIREVAVVFPPRGKKHQPTLQMTLSAMNEEQQALYQALDLDRYRAP